MTVNDEMEYILGRSWHRDIEISIVYSLNFNDAADTDVAA